MLLSRRLHRPPNSGGAMRCKGNQGAFGRILFSGGRKKQVSGPTFCHNDRGSFKTQSRSPNQSSSFLQTVSSNMVQNSLKAPAFIGTMCIIPSNSPSKKTEGEKEAEPVMSSRKPVAGSPLSQQPQVQRPDRTAAHTDERLQSASYALEILSHGRYRNHVINITIQDTSMCLCFYDRVGIVESAALALSTWLSSAG
ncbi:hypothetical protein BS47DRAFT_461436 [Hydnum rufescens UP504]|uniref:Uncharacterized protein n=1 Tax=Hydnum rufescens UP504 TaxID=1448309 RepID=A0A9P6DPB2_9AGAM|nr:hypothetical protein BS47DRAFT_461436 [Hydnum rufescens UP504]